MRTHRATACLRRGVASHLVHAEVLFDHPGAVVKKGAVISPFSNSPRPVSWHPARRSAARPLALPTCRSTFPPSAPRRAALLPLRRTPTTADRNADLQSGSGEAKWATSPYKGVCSTKAAGHVRTLVGWYLYAL